MRTYLLPTVALVCVVACGCARDTDRARDAARNFLSALNRNDTSAVIEYRHGRLTGTRTDLQDARRGPETAVIDEQREDLGGILGTCRVGVRGAIEGASQRLSSLVVEWRRHGT